MPVMLSHDDGSWRLGAAARHSTGDDLRLGGDIAIGSRRVDTQASWRRKRRFDWPPHMWRNGRTNAAALRMTPTSADTMPPARPSFRRHENSTLKKARNTPAPRASSLPPDRTY